MFIVNLYFLLRVSFWVVTLSFAISAMLLLFYLIGLFGIFFFGLTCVLIGTLTFGQVVPA